MYRRLAAIDAEAAARIDSRNIRRVIRALEVYETTGRPLSHRRSKAPPPYATLITGLWLPRPDLYRRIDARVEAMLAAGLVQEVERLLAMGHSRDLPAMSGIGYKEVCQHLGGEADLCTAVQRIKTETHRLARHQSNWLKLSDSRLCWLRADEEALVDEASQLVAGFLGVAARV
jgi:tRNA dimethylallyltransferase